MIVPVMAILNLVLTQQIYSEEINGAHAHYREPVPLKSLIVKRRRRSRGPPATTFMDQLESDTGLSRQDYGQQTGMQNGTDL